MIYLNKYMSSYNLKAKSRHTAEVRDFIAIDMQYDYRYETPDGLIGYTSKEFNTLYEVINDTPIEKGWEEEFNKLFLSTEIRMIREGKSIYETNGVAIKEFIERVEQQAYRQGQEEAYSKSAEVARGVRVINSKTLTLEQQATVRGVAKHVGQRITQAIEQLSSNKE